MARHIDPERVRRETTERVTSELLSDEPAATPEPASKQPSACCEVCGWTASAPPHPTGHEFAPGEHATAPALAAPAISIDDVHRAAFPPPPANADDLAQAAGSLFSQFCAYGEDVRVGVSSKLTVGDVRRAVRERYIQPAEQLTGVIRDALAGVAEELRDGETASDAAKGADEVLWEGEIDGELYRVLSRGQEPDGPMVVRHDSRSDHPQWSATDDDGDYADNWNVAGALATLLRGERAAAAERRASEAEARATRLVAVLLAVSRWGPGQPTGRCWCREPRNRSHEQGCIDANRLLPAKEPTT